MKKDGVVAIIVVVSVFLILLSFTETGAFFTLINILKWLTLIVLPWIFLYWFIRLVKTVEMKKNT